MSEAWRVKEGDCRDVLRSCPDAYFDSVVTDPPYELGFMGRGWDASGVAYDVAMWAEVLRVLKPGGHLLAFGGTRTYHRMACAVEDAGFEIRDCLQWLYGQGFPKSLNVSKAIDKAAGAEREVVGVAVYGDGHQQNSTQSIGYQGSDPDSDTRTITAPATPEAEQWNGWGTALKPANEPIVLARKPLAGTVAANVLAHGTGALNVDGCRISGGRWPANVLLDGTAAAILDEQSGERPGFATQRHLSPAKPGMFGVGDGSETAPLHTGYDDTGGASRFFYVAKAPKKERPVGEDGKGHPTVKPVGVMRYLVRLVTPPGGLILDPFGGTGTTAEAAAAEGFKCVLIESNPDYIPLINQRMERGRNA